MRPAASCSTRRDFLASAARVLAGSSVGVTAGTLLACLGSTDDGKHVVFDGTFDVSPLTADGASLLTPAPGFDGARILIIRKAAREFVALSTQCSHEGCPVNPPVDGVITCPCHGSQYDLDGRVRHGPAQYDLARYATSYEGRRKRLRIVMRE